MAGKMAAAGFRWRSHLLVGFSAPIIVVPLLSGVKAGSMKVHPSELDIYSEPEPLKYQPEAEEITQIEEKVSVARRSVWGWVKSVQTGIAKVRTTLSSVEEKTLEFAELIQTDQTFQIKVGGITAGVVGGALLAGRGRRPIRRVFFSLALGTTAAAVCYPKQAVDITLANYDRLKDFVSEQRKKFNQEKPAASLDQKPNQSVTEEGENPDQLSIVAVVDPSTESEAPKESLAEEITETRTSDAEEVVATTKEVVTKEEPQPSIWSKIPFLSKITGGKSEVLADVVAPASDDSSVDDSQKNKDEVIVQEDSQSPGKAEGDTGQSNPEDKDMYSTRS